MSDQLMIARHFARLVVLAMHEPDAHDAQLATLRALAEACRTGRAVVGTRDWDLTVGNTLVNEPFAGAQELANQLIGHSIGELRLERGATPFDLMCMARILGGVPVPGDGGQSVQRLMRAMNIDSVAMVVQAPDVAIRRISLAPGVQAKEPVAATETLSTFLSNTPIRTRAVAPVYGAAQGELTQEVDTTLFASGSADELAKLDTPQLLSRLNDAMGARGAHLATVLDALVRQAMACAAANQYEDAVHVLGQLMDREPLVRDTSQRAAFTAAIRRLCIPHVLASVTTLLPIRPEEESLYMRILERAEDIGCEALVDALIAAPDPMERRVYFDALLRLKRGVRTLMFMLGDHRWYVVRNAVELLGEMRVANAEPELSRLLDHGDDRVRSAAAGALAKIGTPAAMSALMKGIREDSPTGRPGGAEGLSNAMRTQSVEALIRTLEKAVDPRVHTAVLTALAQIGSPEAVQRLAKIASAENGLFRRTATPLRVSAVRALGQVDSPAATAALAALEQDKTDEVRGAASWVLMGRRNTKGKSRRKPT